MDQRLVIGTYDLDEDLIARVRTTREPAQRVAAVASRMVVLGRGSKPEMELRVDNCLADGVPVLRRGGGCAVFLDEGNIVVSVVLPVTGIAGNDRYFCDITKWLTAGLSEIGVPGVRPAGVSDLALGDRKVGGACIHRSKDVLYYSTTLLISPDVDAMERYLAQPPKEPDYRRGRAHREFVGRLSLPRSMENTEGLAEALRAALKFPIAFGS
ncbi:MAG: hypothetical protein M5R36_08710 [Deltaproteobacteria bacterium]|nr:hypothetical protein [Deltaproteobacteria bacterium]